MARDIATGHGSIPGNRVARTAVSAAVTATADAPRVDVGVMDVTGVIATDAIATGITGASAIGVSTRVRRSP